MKFTHVDGDSKADLKLYALSTCGWCRRTKALLGELNLAYDYVDVDRLTGPDAEQAKSEVRRWNPSSSFPTIVVNDNECIIGYQEDRIRSLAGK